MRWFMIPVSAVAHVAAFLLTLIIPLATGVEAPTPWPISSLPDFVAVTPAPPPPALRMVSVVSKGSPEAAPIRSPDHISDTPAAAVAGPIVQGLGNDLGAAAGVPEGLGMEPAPVVVLPAPPPPKIYPTGGAIREPRKIYHVAPVYPEIARAARVEGLVILEATVDERGVVTGAQVLRSVPLLDGAALAALRQWRYTPTLLNGIPVRVLMTVTFRFSLSDRDI